MINPLSIPDELWAKVPPDAQAAIAAVFVAMQQRIVELGSNVRELETKVRDLEARLKLNSTNSSKPPSSDPIGLKRKPPAPPNNRKRGGQPGHSKTRRPLVPPEQVAESFLCKPSACRRCGRALAGDDPAPLIHAERTMRHAVIWRKISGGTDSPTGSRFVERMLTVVATCRQQRRHVLDYLTSCFEATRRGQPILSLLHVKQEIVKAA